MEQEKVSNVAKSTDERVQRIADILRTSFVVPPANHGAFDDLRARLEFIQRASEALRGLGAMMQPEHGDFPMNNAYSSNAAAVFRFFGEALFDPTCEAYADMERLERAARGERT